VTLEDGVVISAGQSYTKIWRVRNDGAGAWPEGCVFQFTEGDRLGAPDRIAVGSVAPGACAELVVELNIPETAEPRRHVGYWQMADPRGQRFGDRLWVDVTLTPKDVVPSVPAPVQVPAEPKKPEVIPAPAPVPAPLPLPEFVPVPVSVPAPVPVVVAESKKAATPVTPAVQVAARPQVEEVSEGEAEQLETLAGIGFVDSEFNLDLLRHNNHNLEAVLRILLGDH
jgi:next-to-BRCA1 protein 1